MKKKSRQSAVGSGKLQTGMNNIVSENLYTSIKAVINKARSTVYHAVNNAMVETYWHIGKLIVEKKQQGIERAAYGKKLIEGVSQRLTAEFGKGFSSQNLWNMRQFYQKFSTLRRELQGGDNTKILSTLRRELSWSHYKALLRVEKPNACIWYMNEAAEQNWSARALERQSDRKIFGIKRKQTALRFEIHALSAQ